MKHINVMRVLMITAICYFFIGTAISQDIIILKSGEEVRAKVTEVLSGSIKYKKYVNPDGPVYTMVKNEIFMIKYQNGSKDIFSISDSTRQSVSSNGRATFYFYRPKKIASGSAKIIIGTSVPDEVIVKLRNGSWYKTDYTNLGERNFLAGVYVINPETFDIDVEPSKIYYVKCTVLPKGFKIMAKMEIVDKGIAQEEMKNLKEQSKSYVK